MGAEAMVNKAFEDLSQLSAENYIQILQNYGTKINVLITIGNNIMQRIETNADLEAIEQKALYWEAWQKNEKGKENITERQLRYYKNYVKASRAIVGAKKNLNVYNQNKEITIILKQGYKIIHELRAITTGQPTVFTVAVNVGDESQQIIKEVQLPLDEILSVGKLEADYHGGAQLSSALKLRLQASKTKQKAWIEKYPSTDITDIYKMFELETDGFFNIVGAGRQYEFFKKGTSQHYLEKFTLEELAQVARDTRSFVIDVDYISQDDETDQLSYESLKSFLGGAPSLANLSTILNTLQKVSNIINTIGPSVKSMTMNELTSGNDINNINNMIKDAIEKQLKQIFPFAKL